MSSIITLHLQTVSKKMFKYEETHTYQISDINYYVLIDHLVWPVLNSSVSDGLFHPLMTMTSVAKPTSMNDQSEYSAGCMAPMCPSAHSKTSGRAPDGTTDGLLPVLD